MMTLAMATELAWPVAGAVTMLLVVLLLGVMTPSGGSRRSRPSHRHEQIRIYRERQEAIADIVAMRREAEQRMRQIARQHGEVIDGSAVEEPE